MGGDDEAALEQLLDKLDEDWTEKSGNIGWEKVDNGFMTLARARGLLEQLGPSKESKALRERLDKLDGLVAEKLSTILPVGPAPPPGKNPILDLDKYVIKDEPSTSASSSSTVDPTSTASKPLVEEEYVPYQVKPTQTIRQRKVPTSNHNTGGPLESTKKVQEELAHELAQMAGQLKRNALHFSGSLEKDKAVLEAASQQLDSNFDKMQRTQVQTKTMSSKRTGTCFVLAIVVGVSVVFALMVLLIRVT